MGLKSRPKPPLQYLGTASTATDTVRTRTCGIAAQGTEWEASKDPLLHEL
jgi:hypothetical protein